MKIHKLLTHLQNQSQIGSGMERTVQALEMLISQNFLTE